jgi:hypothetical protein
MPQTSSHEPEASPEQDRDNAEHHMAGLAQAGVLSRREGKNHGKDCAPEGLQPDDRRGDQTWQAGLP